MPLSEIYYYGPVIKATSTISTNSDGTQYTTLTLASIDETNQTNAQKLYQTYQSIPFAGNGYLLSSWGPCTSENAVAAKESLNSSWHYLAYSDYSLIGLLFNKHITSQAWKEKMSARYSFEGSEKTLHC